MGSVSSRLGIVVLVLLIAWAGAPVVAQTGGASDRLDPGGHVLRWTDDWTPHPVGSAEDAGFEAVLLQDPDRGYSFGVILHQIDGFDQELLDAFIDGFSRDIPSYDVIDAGSHESVHYELGTGNGSTIFAIMMPPALGTESVGYMVAAPSEAFATAVSAIQDEITIDDKTVLGSVDGAALQEQAAGSSAGTADQPETPRASGASEIVTSQHGTVSVTWGRGWSRTTVEGQQFSLTDGTSIISVSTAPTSGVDVFTLHDLMRELVDDNVAGSASPVSVVGGSGFMVAKHTSDGMLFGQEWIVQGSSAIVTTFIVPVGSEASFVQSVNGSVAVNGTPPLPSLVTWVSG